MRDTSRCLRVIVLFLASTLFPALTCQGGAVAGEAANCVLTEDSLNKQPGELVWKAVLQVYAGGTREQPLKTPEPLKIAPDPEAERMIAERKAAKQPTSEPFQGRDNFLTRREWENFLATKPRFPKLERRFAEAEIKSIIEVSKTFHD